MAPGGGPCCAAEEQAALVVEMALSKVIPGVMGALMGGELTWSGYQGRLS